MLETPVTTHTQRTVTQRRNNVVKFGSGPLTLLFVHGFGFDQKAWMYITRHFADRFSFVLIDLVGSGASDFVAYDPDRHATLRGHADDLLDVVNEIAPTPVVLVGHSVGSTVCLLSTIKSPERFSGLIMIGATPSLINDGAYVGGFQRRDVDSLLEALETNFLGWSSTMAPAVLGSDAPRKDNIRFAETLARNDLNIAKHFSRVTLLADHRADLPHVAVPTLIIQSTHDAFVPPVVGDYMTQMIKGSRLAVIHNTGHCPHITAPEACADAIDAFLTTLPLASNEQSKTKTAEDSRLV